MNLLMAAIRDKKSLAFMQPFFARTKPEAIRAFADAVNDPKTQFHGHPGDYHLFAIGVFDDDTGEIVSLKTEELIDGLACVNKM